MECDQHENEIGYRPRRCRRTERKRADEDAPQRRLRERGRLITLPYRVARTVSEALKFKADLGPEARWLAGGTAMQLAWLNGEPEHPIIDIGRLDCEPAVAPSEKTLRLSATATLETIRRHPLIAARLPILATAIGVVGALGVRHLGTIGGNLVWGAGDLVPLFLALEANLIGADGAAMPLAARLADGCVDLVVGIELPWPSGRVAFEKLGRRAAFCPSLVTVAAAESATGVRCAIGGGAVPPQVLTISAVADAAALDQQFAAPDDAFATGAYRRLAAARLLEGHLSRWDVSIIA